MATIRCILGDDGSLTPQAVEFEPGDLVEFIADEPGDAMEVLDAFTLEDLAEHDGQLMIKLKIGRGKGPRGPWHAHPKLPPPPPGDGDVIFNSGASGNAISIKVVIDKKS